MPTIHGVLVMVGTLRFATLRTSRVSLLRHFSERLADWQHSVPDQPRILHGGLTVLDRLAINGITDHLDEG